MIIDPYFETLIALDVGERRIGVARAHKSVLIPAPLTTLQDPDRFIEDIITLCRDEKAAGVVAGLPRGLSGQQTAQTDKILKFGRQLEEKLDVPVYWIDEAVTSEQAEAELRRRGKPYAKADIDALAAVYILDDFINEHPELKN